MTVAQLGLVLDCADPEHLAELWAPALGTAARAKRADLDVPSTL